jgi:hypothetical protein
MEINAGLARFARLFLSSHSKAMAHYINVNTYVNTVFTRVPVPVAFAPAGVAAPGASDFSSVSWFPALLASFPAFPPQISIP